MLSGARQQKEGCVQRDPCPPVAPALQGTSPESPAGTPGYSSLPERSKRRRWWWSEMSSKAEVIRRVELIDQLSTILKDLRRSEMKELKRIEDEEDSLRTSEEQSGGF